MRVDVSNLVDLCERSCAKYADRPLYGTRSHDSWTWTRYSEFAALVDRFRAGLASLGVIPGDRVAIVAPNCVQWAVACYATYGLGAVFVPMYAAQGEREWRFILRDCDARVVIGATDVICARLESLRSDLPMLRHIVSIAAPASQPNSFEALLMAGDRAPVPARHPSTDTDADLIYTSGTTGNPKGAILTHGNIASNVTAMSELFPLEPDDRSLSFLPWAHAYGQTIEVHYLISQGASSALNDAADHLIANLPDVRPTVLVAVPAIFDKIYTAVQQQIAERPGFVQRMVRDGIRAAQRRNHGERTNWFENLELSLDDRLVFQKVRERFGGRLRFVASASAALSPAVAEFIDALGITVYEGYGLTETSPVVAINYPGHRKIGSVGVAIPGVRVVIDPTASVSMTPGEGEIVIYGPNVMRGYHNRPEENAKAFTPDGGFRTGDIGRFDADGYLYITGRVKEQYKLSSGRYVMPAPVEETLRLSPYIANVFLHGAGRPYNVALVVLETGAIEKWARDQGFTVADPAQDARVRALIEREIAEHARDVRAFEAPRRLLLTTEALTAERDMITPTLKLKRRNVEARWGAELEALYEADAQETAPQSAPG